MAADGEETWAGQPRRFGVRDLIGGGLTILVGLAVIYESSHYPMGSLLRMGPGFFPTVLGTALIVLGGLLTLQGLRGGTSAATGFLLRPVIMIPLGMAAFALLLERMGLVPATLALVFLSSLSEPIFRPARSLLLSLGLLAMVYIVFVLILRLQIPVLRW
jgi:hypothetical protein